MKVSFDFLTHTERVIHDRLLVTVDVQPDGELHVMDEEKAGTCEVSVKQLSQLQTCSSLEMPVLIQNFSNLASVSFSPLGIVS